jgi:nitrile hydratase subunit beta
VNGPQDIGGRQGLGPIAPAPGEPVFHADWERRVFGLAFCSWLSSGVAVDESRRAQSEMPYARYYGSSYYERWLHALVTLMVEKGVIGEDEIDGGSPPSEPVPPPLIAPDELAGAAVALASGGLERVRPASSAPRFEPGQPVRARNANPPTYDRLPSYLKGRPGVVDAHCGSFPHPEDLAAGRLAEPGAHCYRIRFRAHDLWGESAEGPEDSVCVDLFESYLEPA